MNLKGAKRRLQALWESPEVQEIVFEASDPVKHGFVPNHDGLNECFVCGEPREKHGS